jgi:hypothetical protein
VFVALTQPAQGVIQLAHSDATEFDCRDLVLWFRWLVSFETLGTALGRAAASYRDGA